MIDRMNTETPPGAYPLHDYYSKIVGRYDIVNRLFTFGNDRKWRRKAARMVLKQNPSDVIDLCCGTGDLTMEILELSNRSIKMTGFDFNAQMLREARTKAEKKSLTGIEFVVGDVASMPFVQGTFDAASVAFGLRNLIFSNPNSEKHINEIKRIIKPGGSLIILESTSPSNRIVNFFFRIYLNLFLVPLGGIISGNWKAYKYLAGSSSKFFNSARLLAYLEENGFIPLSVSSFFMGAVTLATVKKA